MKFGATSSSELKEFLVSIIGNAPYGILTIAVDLKVSVTNELVISHLFPDNASQSLLGRALPGSVSHIPQLDNVMREITEWGRKDFDLDEVKVGERILSIKGRRLVNGMVIVTGDGTALYQALHDVAELNQNLEKLVDERTQELTTLNRDLKAFTGMIAHDLKAPINAISGYANVLLEEVGQNPYAQRICAISEKVKVQIDEMLESAFISTTQVHKEPLDLSGCFQEVFHEVNGVSATKAELTVEGSFSVRGDKRMLKIAFRNFITNSIKYVAAGVNPSIVFGYDQGEEAFFVKDNGIGIPEQSQAKVFEAFERAANSDGYEGTGLGLHAVKRVFEKHGGHIWLQSEVGMGTTFYFHLPD